VRYVALVALLTGKVVSQEPITSPELARLASADVVFTFRVADGYHVQANPPAAKFLVPTSLRLRTACGVKAGPPVYPAPLSFRLEGADQDLAVWNGRFQVTVPLRAGRLAHRGECLLHGTLEYQACDVKRCLAPTSLEVVLPIRIR
jgi:thioredoxin:protein disulfide reductase